MKGQESKSPDAPLPTCLSTFYKNAQMLISSTFQLSKLGRSSNNYPYLMLTETQTSHYNLIEIMVYQLSKDIKLNFGKNCEETELSSVLIKVRNVIDQMEKFCNSIKIGFIFQIFQKTMTCLIMISSINYVGKQNYTQQWANNQTEISQQKQKTTPNRKQSKRTTKTAKKVHFMDEQQEQPTVIKKSKLRGVSLYNENYQRYLQNRNFLINLKQCFLSNETKNQFWKDLQQQFKETVGVVQNTKQNNKGINQNRNDQNRDQQDFNQFSKSLHIEQQNSKNQVNKQQQKNPVQHLKRLNNNVSNILVCDLSSRNGVMNNAQKIVNNLTQIYQNQKNFTLDSIKKLIKKLRSFYEQKQKTLHQLLKNEQQKILKLEQKLFKKCQNTRQFGVQSIFMGMAGQKNQQMQRQRQHEKLKQEVKRMEAINDGLEKLVRKQNKQVMDLQKQNMLLQRSGLAKSKKCQQLEKKISDIYVEKKKQDKMSTLVENQSVYLSKFDDNTVTSQFKQDSQFGNEEEFVKNKYFNSSFKVQGEGQGSGYGEDDIANLILNKSRKNYSNTKSEKVIRNIFANGMKKDYIKEQVMQQPENKIKKSLKLFSSFKNIKKSFDKKTNKQRQSDGNQSFYKVQDPNVKSIKFSQSVKMFQEQDYNQDYHEQKEHGHFYEQIKQRPTQRESSKQLKLCSQQYQLKMQNLLIPISLFLLNSPQTANSFSASKPQQSPSHHASSGIPVQSPSHTPQKTRQEQEQQQKQNQPQMRKQKTYRSFHLTKTHDDIININQYRCGHERIFDIEKAVHNQLNNLNCSERRISQSEHKGKEKQNEIQIDREKDKQNSIKILNAYVPYRLLKNQQKNKVLSIIPGSRQNQLQPSTNASPIISHEIKKKQRLAQAQHKLKNKLKKISNSHMHIHSNSMELQVEWQQKPIYMPTSPIPTISTHNSPSSTTHRKDRNGKADKNYGSFYGNFNDNGIVKQKDLNSSWSRFQAQKYSNRKRIKPAVLTVGFDCPTQAERTF